MYTCTHTHAHTHVRMHKHTWAHTHVFTFLLLHSCYMAGFRNGDSHLFTQAHTPRCLFDLKNSSQVFDQKKQRQTQAWAGSKLSSSISQGLIASLQGHYFCLMRVVGYTCQHYSELTSQAHFFEPTAELVLVQTEVNDSIHRPSPHAVSLH